MNCARFCRAKLGTPALAAAIRSPNMFSLCRTDPAALDDQRCAVRPFGLSCRCLSLRVLAWSRRMHRRTPMSG